jgi:hypothetical protein
MSELFSGALGSPSPVPSERVRFVLAALDPPCAVAAMRLLPAEFGRAEAVGLVATHKTAGPSTEQLADAPALEYRPLRVATERCRRRHDGRMDVCMKSDVACDSLLCLGSCGRACG